MQTRNSLFIERKVKRRKSTPTPVILDTPPAIRNLSFMRPSQLCAQPCDPGSALRLAGMTAESVGL